jgi:hypothetical protein
VGGWVIGYVRRKGQEERKTVLKKLVCDLRRRKGRGELGICMYTGERERERGEKRKKRKSPCKQQ